MRYSNAVEERYARDIEFAALVDAIYNMIVTLKTTPTEVREAVMLAQLKYEMRFPRPIVFSPDLLREIEMGSHK